MVLPCLSQLSKRGPFLVHPLLNTVVIDWVIYRHLMRLVFSCLGVQSISNWL